MILASMSVAHLVYVCSAGIVTSLIRPGWLLHRVRSEYGGDLPSEPLPLLPDCPWGGLRRALSPDTWEVDPPFKSGGGPAGA